MSNRIRYRNPTVVKNERELELEVPARVPVVIMPANIEIRYESARSEFENMGIMQYIMR